MKQCLICDNYLPDHDPKKDWPVCPQACFWILTQAINHRETACWISCEVYCQNGYCVSFDEHDVRQECEVFKLERVIKERGLDKEELIENY